jgi:hypothetical protein
MLRGVGCPTNEGVKLLSTYNKYHQLYYYKHKKEIRKRTKEYRRQYAKEYYQRNKEHILIKRAEAKVRRETNQQQAQG